MTGRGFTSKTFLLFSAMAIVLLVLLVYASSLPFESISYDDPKIIYHNEPLKQLSWERIGVFFTPGAMLAYTPLRWISYAVDFKLHGADPFYIRLVNLLLYMLTGWFCFLFLRKLYARLWPDWNSERGGKDLAGIAALISTAAFLLHPIHVEGVVWLSGRKEVLMGTFFFAGLWLYLFTYHAERSRKSAALAGAFFCFTAACLSKAFAIVFPAAMLVIDLVLLRSLSAKRVIARGLMYLPFVFFNLWFIRISLQNSLAMSSISKAVEGDSFQASLPNRMYLVGQSFARYLELTIWPHPLTVQYLYDLKITLLDRGLWLDLLLVFILLVVAVVLWLKKRAWSFPILWFFACLIPGVGLLPNAIHWADRYLFLSVLGICILIGAGGVQVFNSAQTDFKRKAIAAFGSFVLLLWLMLSLFQVSHWKNSTTLFEYTLNTWPDHHLAAMYLAQEYMKKGDRKQALQVANKAYELNPHDPRIISQKAVLEFELGGKHQDLARRFLTEEAAKQDQCPEIWKNLAVMLLRQGKQQQAVDAYRKGMETEWRSSYMISLQDARFMDVAGEKEQALNLYNALVKRYDGKGYPMPKEDIERLLEETSKGKGASVE